MEYMDTKEVAKLVRKELKTHFPMQKFSVRIERYSMGSSINVTWIDGPMVKDVEAIAGHFVYNPDGNGILYRYQINVSIGNDCKPIECNNWNLR